MTQYSSPFCLIRFLFTTILFSILLPANAQQKKIVPKKTPALPIISRLPDSFSKRSLEEIENPYGLEEGSNTRVEYSVLARDTGFLNIGSYRIRISGFTKIEHQEISGKIKFPDSLSFVAIVFLQDGEPRDTVVLKGTKPSASLINKLEKKPANADPYAWQQLNRTLGFGNDCPPGDCRRHFITITKSNRLIKVIEPEEMPKILPRIHSSLDALFAITKRNHLPTAKTAKIKDGFLILLNEKISDCPIDFADVLYKVSFTGKIEKLGMVITKKTTLCH
jgi:hypothetical protein